MPINKELIEKRQEVKQNKPDFVRPESWRYVRLQTNWRKPKGIDHHQRKQKSRGRPGLVKVGYGGPKDRIEHKFPTLFFFSPLHQSHWIYSLHKTHLRFLMLFFH